MEKNENKTKINPETEQNIKVYVLLLTIPSPNRL